MLLPLLLLLHVLLLLGIAGSAATRRGTDLQAHIFAADKLAEVTMSSSSPGRPLLGVGIETLGHELIGGVYSNLLFDESFEHPAPQPVPGQSVTTSGGWFRQPGHSGQCSIDVVADALAGNHSQRLGSGAVIYNAGVNQQAPQGFAFERGSSYSLSFYARAWNNQSTNVSALLFGPKGIEPTDIPPVLASANFYDVPGDGIWRRYNATLTVGQCASLAPLITKWCQNGPGVWWCQLDCCAASGAACSTDCDAGGDGRITCGGTFAFSNSGNADVSLDYVVLEKVGDRLTNSPTKRSLAKLLQEQGVTFMRFGGDMASTCHSWKHYRGLPEHRNPRDAYGIAWYEQLGGSTSWMYFEFIAMCEELGIIPVIGLDFAHGTAQDTSDIVEYLYGSADTTYGALRAKDGHPAPCVQYSTVQYSTCFVTCCRE